MSVCILWGTACNIEYNVTACNIEYNVTFVTKESLELWIPACNIEYNVTACNIEYNVTFVTNLKESLELWIPALQQFVVILYISICNLTISTTGN